MGKITVQITCPAGHIRGFPVRWWNAWFLQFRMMRWGKRHEFC